MAPLCGATSDQDLVKIKGLDEIKEAMKKVLEDKEYELFEGRVDNDNYRIVDDWLREFLRANSAIPIGDIATNWPSIGSQKFIDKMQRKIDYYHRLQAAIADWDDFLYANGGTWKIDWRHRH